MFSRRMFLFIAQQMLTARFWMCFIASFGVVLCLALRSYERDMIFAAAQRSIGKR